MVESMYVFTPGYVAKYVSMNVAASRRENSVRDASPWALIPYTIPKFVVFASRRMSSVTSSSETSCRLAAVAAWMSCPFAKAWHIAASSLMCASTRRSICE